MKHSIKQIFYCSIISVGLCTPLVLRAEEMQTKEIQQTLHDQGFYFGPINGEVTEETTQAIRRFQIRNGLQVTGQLDSQTAEAITNKTQKQTATEAPPAESSDVPPPLASPAPMQNSATGSSDASVISSSPSFPNTTPIPQYTTPPPTHLKSPKATKPSPSKTKKSLSANSGKQTPNPELMEYFEDTPYEFSPPSIQRDVLRRAKVALSREGLYRGSFTTQATDELYNSLIEFQAVIRVPQSGRLDMPTLRALKLMPKFRANEYIYEPM